jgi:hypothetical protein
MINNGIFGYAYSGYNTSVNVTANAYVDYIIDSTLSSGYQRFIINNQEFNHSYVTSVSPISLYLFASHDPTVTDSV